MKALDNLGARYTSILFALSWIVAGVAAAHLAAFLVPGRWVLPLVNAGLFSVLFLAALRRGDYSRAVRLGIIWGVITSLVQIGLTLGWPSFMESRIWHSVQYRREMFTWVRTGAGPEGDIRLFLPIHLKHFTIFCAASAASGGLLGLTMGAVLLGYMNFYVGCLVTQSADPLVASLLAWPVWSVVRVVGYIIAGTALGALLVHRDRERAGGKFLRIKRMFLLALALIVLDIFLKWALAGVYQQALERAFT
ncbi:MAG: hypothetical protein U9P14_00720 [Gemmatimonadota bacterium]|nr:hypothetical protein [Gemmatimonadota bacterium]